MDNNLINNRPKELFDIEYYTELPQLPFELEVPLASNFLGTDIFLLSGIMPKTVDLIEKQEFAFLLLDYQRRKWNTTEAIIPNSR
ncbi:hypothetical protein ACIXMM_03540 [Bacteroides fragilis]